MSGRHNLGNERLPPKLRGSRSAPGAACRHELLHHIWPFQRVKLPANRSCQRFSHGCCAH
eukprot:scaffold171707_cov19-Tisochrysis_lutea.AAC.1